MNKEELKAKMLPLLEERSKHTLNVEGVLDQCFKKLNHLMNHSTGAAATIIDIEYAIAKVYSDLAIEHDRKREKFRGLIDVIDDTKAPPRVLMAELTAATIKLAMCEGSINKESEVLDKAIETLEKIVELQKMPNNTPVRAPLDKQD